MLIKKNTQTAYEPAKYEGINLTFPEIILLSHHFLPEDDEPQDDRDEFTDPEEEAEDDKSADNQEDEPMPDEEDLEQNDLTTEQADAVEWDPEDDE